MHRLVPHLFAAITVGRLGWMAVLFLLFFSGCAVKNRIQVQDELKTTLSFGTDGIIAIQPWISSEIRYFLGQEEVRSVLGFDPLHSAHPILIQILEHRLTHRHDMMVFGLTVNEKVSISSHIFVEPRIEKIPEPSVTQGWLWKKRISMLRELWHNPRLLRLYRGMLVAHEVAHVGEWYVMVHRGSRVCFTGHGVTNRVEIKILTRLYLSGKIDPEIYAGMLHFYMKYLNNEGQSEDDVKAYLTRNLILPFWVAVK